MVTCIMSREEIFVFSASANDGVIFDEVWSMKMKVFTEAVVIAIFTDRNKAKHTHSRCLALCSASIWSCSGGGVGHGSEPVAVNGAQSRVSSSTLQPRLGPPLWACDGGGWVGWLELLELVTGSEPAGQSQRVTPSLRWQSPSYISL